MTERRLSLPSTIALYLIGFPDDSDLSGSTPVFFRKFFLVLPNFLADLLIFGLLLKTFPKRKNAILGLYFLSPIVLYAVYAHGQMDLLPTVFLFLSLHRLLKGGYRYADIALALAVSMKLHMVAALPMFLFYIYRKEARSIGQFVFPFLIGFSVISLPWYLSPYFRETVLFNPEQDLLFSSIYKIGEYKLLVPVFACLLVFFKFFSYRKVNQDLLITWLAIFFLFSFLPSRPHPDGMYGHCLFLFTSI